MRQMERQVRRNRGKPLPSSLLPCLQETSGGCLLKVLLRPRSQQNKIDGLQGDALKIWVNAPPLEGKANEACLRFLADQLGAHRSQLSLRGSQISRHKLIAISGCPAEVIQDRLNHLLGLATQDLPGKAQSWMSETEGTTKSGR